MAITERTLTDAEYVALRYALIKQLEGISATPYFDADYNPNANNGGGNSSSPSFFRNSPGTEPALARPVLGPQARGGLSLVFPFLLALCCALALPAVAQAGEKQAQVKPRVKYYQYKDTGWNVCRDMVKNLNKLQPSQASFWCKLRFHPDMPQFSEPEWEVLKIEDNWQMIYDLSNYWVKTSDRLPFAKWQAQYLRDMQNGYIEGEKLPSGASYRHPFRPSLRRAKVRFEQNGPLVTVVSYTGLSLAEQENFCETLYTTCPYNRQKLITEDYCNNYEKCISTVAKNYGYENFYRAYNMSCVPDRGLVYDVIYLYVPENELYPGSNSYYMPLENIPDNRWFFSHCGRQLFLYKGRAFSISDDRTICRAKKREDASIAFYRFSDICMIMDYEQF